MRSSSVTETKRMTPVPPDMSSSMSMSDPSSSLSSAQPEPCGGSSMLGLKALQNSWLSTS